MQAKFIGAALLAATAAAVVLYPSIRSSATSPPPPEQRTPLPAQAAGRVDVVFVLDTTGSMSGLIAAAKEKIWSIAASMAQAEPTPLIRIGLVGFRDRGDAYVTRVVDLSSDLDSMYARLMDFAAEGGGDGPESVNRALHDAVHAMSWSTNADSYRVIFLVGDAPPHLDYQDEQPYPQIVAAAAAKGIIVNTIQCGDMPDTARAWQHIAALGQGTYFRVDAAGSTVAIETPFDAEIAELSAQLDATRMYYGSAEERAGMRGKLAATARLEDSATTSARARRGIFNASASGAANLLGGRDLVEDVESGRIDVGAVPAAELPESLAELPVDEQRQVVAKTAAQRDALQRQITTLAKQREAYIDAELDARGGADESLDAQLYEAVRDQAAAKGLSYAGGPKF